MKRRRMTRRIDKKIFTRTAEKTNSKNLPLEIYRGGIRQWIYMLYTT